MPHSRPFLPAGVSRLSAAGNKCLKIALLAALCVGAGLCHAAMAQLSAKDYSGTYEGTYKANQGVTRAVLVLEAADDATLDCHYIFYADNSNRSVPTGHYIGTAKVDVTGKIRLVGTKWVVRPTNYEMLDLGGILSEDRLTFAGQAFFTGSNEFVGTFKLQRLTKLP